MTTGYLPPGPPRRSASGPIALALAGAALSITGYLLWDRLRPFQPHAPAAARAVTPRAALGTAEENRIEVAARVSPSVVHITTPDQVVRDGYGQMFRVRGGTGSGFIWDQRGYIVTNYHVVRSVVEARGSLNDGKLLVRLVDREAYDARFVAAKPEFDIAVIKLVNPPGDLPAIAVGRSSDLRVGQSVLAIGNPFGLDHSLSAGVISALDRTIESILDTPIPNVIQVDAAINPGNSGGPLLDSAGRLIGMNTAIKSPTGANAGIGFAVPVDLINQVVPGLIQGKSDRPAQPILGILTGSVQLSLGRQDYRGLVVLDVFRKSGAERAGLIARSEAYGDVILKVDDQPTPTVDALRQVLEQRKPGDAVRLVAVRGYPQRPELVELQVVLSSSQDY